MVCIAKPRRETPFVKAEKARRENFYFAPECTELRAAKERNCIELRASCITSRVRLEYFSEDPIGFAAGDANLYRYVENSPTNFTDPDGLIKVRYWSTYHSEYARASIAQGQKEIALKAGQSTTVHGTGKFQRRRHKEIIDYRRPPFQSTHTVALPSDSLTWTADTKVSCICKNGKYKLKWAGSEKDPGEVASQSIEIGIGGSTTFNFSYEGKWRVNVKDHYEAGANGNYPTLTVYFQADWVASFSLFAALGSGPIEGKPFEYSQEDVMKTHMTNKVKITCGP